MGGWHYRFRVRAVITGRRLRRYLDASHEYMRPLLSDQPYLSVPVLFKGVLWYRPCMLHHVIPAVSPTPPPPPRCAASTSASTCAAFSTTGPPTPRVTRYECGHGGVLLATPPLFDSPPLLPSHLGPVYPPSPPPPLTLLPSPSSSSSPPLLLPSPSSSSSPRPPPPLPLLLLFLLLPLLLLPSPPPPPLPLLLLPSPLLLLPSP